MASLLREALARAQGFLVEPVPAADINGRRSASRTEVAVMGLSARCGVTTLARGLALWLELPDRSRGRVWDLAADDVNRARELAHRLDSFVLVAGAGTEPALAEVAAQMLREDFPRLLVVANRVTDPSRWDGRSDFLVPESWLGAALVGRSRRPPGAFGDALRRLARLVEDG